MKSEKQRLLVASIFFGESHVISKGYYPKKNGVKVIRIAAGYREASLNECSIHRKSRYLPRQENTILTTCHQRFSIFALSNANMHCLTIAKMT